LEGGEGICIIDTMGPKVSDGEDDEDLLPNNKKMS